MENYNVFENAREGDRFLVRADKAKDMMLRFGGYKDGKVLLKGTDEDIRVYFDIDGKCLDNGYTVRTSPTYKNGYKSEETYIPLENARVVRNMDLFRGSVYTDAIVGDVFRTSVPWIQVELIGMNAYEWSFKRKGTNEYMEFDRDGIYHRDERISLLENLTLWRSITRTSE